MFARCPSCQRPAVLDLPASMLNHDSDLYGCPVCRQQWTVEKRTGQLHMAAMPTAVRKLDRRAVARNE